MDQGADCNPVRSRHSCQSHGAGESSGLSDIEASSRRAAERGTVGMIGFRVLGSDGDERAASGTIERSKTSASNYGAVDAGA